MFSIAPLLAALALGAPAPAWEVRLRPLSDWVDTAALLATPVESPGQRPLIAAGQRLLAAGKDGVFGIDPARPLGFYARLTPDLVDSEVVLTLPTANGEALRAAVGQHLGLTSAELAPGLYRLDGAKLPVPVFARFAPGVAYFTLADARALAPTRIIPHAAFFAAGPPAALLESRLHLGGVPEVVRRTLLVEFELAAWDRLAAAERAWPPETRAGVRDALAAAGRTAKQALAQGDVWSLTLARDGPGYAWETRLVPRPGTPFARRVAPLGVLNLTLPASTLVGALPLTGLSDTGRDAIRQELAKPPAGQGGARLAAAGGDALSLRLAVPAAALRLTLAPVWGLR